MPYTNRATLLETIDSLNGQIRHAEGEKIRLLLENESLRKLVNQYERHMNCMTVGSERLAQALAQSITVVDQKERRNR